MRPALEDERDLEPWDDDPDGVDARYIREPSEPGIARLRNLTLPG